MESLIDTHLHLVYPEHFRYPWMAAAPTLQKPFTLGDYEEQTAEAGIASALFMEVDVDSTQSLEETRFFADMAEAGASPLAGVIAAARPENPGFEASLEEIVRPSVRGIRRVLHVVEDGLSQSPLFRENLRILGRRKLPFDLCILPRQGRLGLDLVDHCPETLFVLDHCGNPNLSEPETFGFWKRLLNEYAQRENVVVKLSGIVATGRSGEVDDATVHPYLDVTLEAFGPGRALWGSDWPVCTLTTSMTAWINIFRNWLSRLSEDEQEAIAHQNACRTYQLE